jgi:hypothetical protein
MAEERQKSLPNGEYFLLIDKRRDFEVLAERSVRVPGSEDARVVDQHDQNSSRSGGLAMLRFARHRELEPDLPPGSWLTLYSNRRHRFDAALVSEASHFYGAEPAHLIHFDYLFDFANEPIMNRLGKFVEIPGQYYFVSEEWKCAVEEIEPGVHQFFSHTVYFSSSAIEDHLIFRDCREFNFLDGDIVSQLSCGKEQERPVDITPIIGCHWIRQTGLRAPIVSRELATRLLPILPKTVRSPPLSFVPLLTATRR